MANKFSSKFSTITAMSTKNIFTELLSVSYPSLPFFEFIPEGVAVGTVIFIEAFMPQNCSQFSIDLIDGETVDEKTSKQADIPLGISFLIDDKLFVGNTRRDGEWGRPQKERLPNIKGENFQMKITVEESQYRIVTNGRSVVYPHRMCSDRPKLLRIDGNFVLKRIEFRHGKHFRYYKRDYLE